MKAKIVIALLAMASFAVGGRKMEVGSPEWLVARARMVMSNPAAYKPEHVERARQILETHAIIQQREAERRRQIEEEMEYQAQQNRLREIEDRIEKMERDANMRQ